MIHGDGNRFACRARGCRTLLLRLPTVAYNSGKGTASRTPTCKHTSTLGIDSIAANSTIFPAYAAFPYGDLRWPSHFALSRFPIPTKSVLGFGQQPIHSYFAKIRPPTHPKQLKHIGIFAVGLGRLFLSCLPHSKSLNYVGFGSFSTPFWSASDNGSEMDDGIWYSQHLTTSIS